MSRGEESLHGLVGRLAVEETMRRFRNRREAGRELAAVLQQRAFDRPVVLGLPRGGVPVAAEVARALHAPLDVIVVRKLGVPCQPELGMGAVGEDGVLVLNQEIVAVAGIRSEAVASAEKRERAEVERRACSYRGDAPMVPLEGCTAVVVDDGIATGGTARAALQVARAHGAARVVLAVPVAPPDTDAALGAAADDIVILETPIAPSAVGQWYDDFSQVSDQEVNRILGAARIDAERSDGPSVPAEHREVMVSDGPVALPGTLVVPANARGIVLFAHGSGSGRHSPRSVYVARQFHAAGLGTLLFDLLMPDESLNRANVFDIELLAVRLLTAARWLRNQPNGHLPLGYFGASTGAAAALWAAAEDPSVAAVVSRGGRPDLAAPRLDAVEAATLLIVGGADVAVLRLNEDAARLLRCEHRLSVVPGATHLFEEPGALETVADLASAWFVEHFTAAKAARIGR
jgi:putative phosphoribosyl transferase